MLSANELHMETGMSSNFIVNYLPDMKGMEGWSYLQEHTVKAKNANWFAGSMT